MALPSTLLKIKLQISDVDRAVYHEQEMRVARHPSESERYLVTRLLAYALSYEEGCQFSRAGLSDVTEPPVFVQGLQGERLAFIDVGSPSADRLHKASKAWNRVALFTWLRLDDLRKALGNTSVHAADRLVVTTLPPEFYRFVEARLDRAFSLDVMRSDGVVYLTMGDDTESATLEVATLAPSE